MCLIITNMKIADSWLVNSRQEKIFSFFVGAAIAALRLLGKVSNERCNNSRQVKSSQVFFICPTVQLTNCPATQQGGKKMAKISINEKWCKQCGYCIAFCPNQVYGKEIDGSPLIQYADKCSVCQLCVKRCPDFAIRVEG